MKIAEEHQSHVRAWDLPTCIVHWSIAIAVPILWWTGSHGKWQMHMAVGNALFGFVVFRIIWGFIGASTARFVHLLKGPRQVLRYSRTLFSGRETWTEVGHNPLGSWSAVALLATLAMSVTSGLFSETPDGLAEGPLSRFPTEDIVQAATVTHQAAYELLLALLVLHRLRYRILYNCQAAELDIGHDPWAPSTSPREHTAAARNGVGVCACTIGSNRKSRSRSLPVDGRSIGLPTLKTGQSRAWTDDRDASPMGQSFT